MLLEFDVHLWGDEDPLGQDSLYSFNTAVELYREFIGAACRQLGNVPELEMRSATFFQPTDDRRLGRVLHAPFAFSTDLTDEPYTILPYSTQTTSGVQVHATVVEIFPDGSSTSSGVIIAPP